MREVKALSNIQQELLKIYANNIDENQLLDIKMMLGRYFADRATKLMDDFIEQNNLSSKDILNWANEHDRY